MSDNVTYSRTQIAALSPQERTAGYLVRSAKLAELGARLRTKYKDVATDYHEGWSKTEEAEWDRQVDELDIWYYQLQKDERVVVRYVEKIFAQLNRAEWPINIPSI